ncbi:MAG TPA: hypothetical protein VE442_08580 [Jatrophihabitans sp.]|nr:hypothetical protein [Jatrophihabitans sp.]
MLRLRGCRFESGRYGGLPRLEDDGQIRTANEEWDLDQFGMPASDVELLCASHGDFYGRFVLRPSAGVIPPLMARRISTLLAAHFAAAYNGHSTAA